MASGGFALGGAGDSIPLGNRWAAYLTDNEPPEIAFFYPECAEWEFGK